MNRTVIVIDDDKDQASLLSEIIETIGTQVSGIGFNGKEAIKLFEKHKPDLVFLDVMMPEFDGFYAIDGIRKIDKEAKIIAITGDLDKNTQQKLKENNVSILYKPFSIDDIIQFVKN